ncbi:MAG TPA: TldD/PmbA family protein [Bacillota bacterium]|nr:TldD/PmbA family protein [Bacillota bacterium]
MLNKEDLQEVLALALRHGGDFADIFLEEKQTLSIGCERDKIERINSGIDAGAGIRVIHGETTAYGYTNDLSVSGLTEAAKVVSHVARGPEQEVKVRLSEAAPGLDFQVKERPDAVSLDRKVDMVLRANKEARSQDQRIKQVSVGYGETLQKVTMANSEGEYVDDERIRTRFVLNAIAAEGTAIQTGYHAIGGVQGFEIFEENDPEQVAREAARRAILMLSAKPAPAGRMPVVMAGEAGGTMVHEACGHGLEADLVQKRLSVYQGKKGEQVASPLVTVIDDATLPCRYGFYRYDDEGTPSQECVLIKDGVLVDYLYDRNTARKEGRSSNGHGRRESYQDKPIPRMGNTFIAPGKEDPELIIKDVKQGLLVKKMGGGQVNTTTGDFVFEVAEGYLLKDGEIAFPVKGATLTGNGPEELQKVARVGRDLGFTIGTCGKDGQGAPVSDAQPTMLIPDLIVGGTEVGDGENPSINKIRRL